MPANSFNGRALLLTALLCASAAAQNSDLDQGLALLEKGRFAEAVPLLSRATEAHGQDARAWKALGVAYAAQGQYDRAEPAFRRSCGLDPKLADACYFQGRALYALDRFDESIAVLEKAAVLEPRSWKLRLGIAQAQEGIGRADAAEKSFRQTLALARNADPQPGTAFGLFLLRQGRSEEAVPLLTELLQRFPDSGDARLHLGRALLEQGKAADAIPHLERAIVLQPASAQAHLLLAKAYVRVGRAADAQSHFEAAARYDEANQGKTAK